MDKLSFLNKLQIDDTSVSFFDITRLTGQGFGNINRLPYTIRILVENLLRKYDDKIVGEQDLQNITNWQKSYDSPVEIPYHPARVLMQDFTGVPAVVDLAALRDAVRDQGGDPAVVNPLVPVELVADHSVQVDFSGTSASLSGNVTKEYDRNGERYTVFKWAQSSFDNFRVVPPNSGICHQVNLEHLGRVTITCKMAVEDKEITVAHPDTVVGLDSHTTMINGIGVMGWGVGGIEAEAVMLGQPYYMSIPEVVGVRLSGELKAGITATDLVLTLTQLLRQVNVVEKFVEYFGPGMQHLSIPDRATVANMTPEYGATLGFFPIDEKTIDYLKLTGRNREAALTDGIARSCGLFYDDSGDIEYSQVIEFDLGSVEPSLAGPARPQDRIPLSAMKQAFGDILGCRYERDTRVEQVSTFIDESGCETTRKESCHAAAKRDIEIVMNGKPVKIGDGSVVIAAITSCTNTSNPHVLIGTGLMAKAAVKRGLRVPGYVKTSFAPGSRVVSNYLDNSGLTPYLEALGFHIAAFGCTTCIGNSGPLNPELANAIEKHELNVAAVLSGNRNFEARIHQQIKSNFLASPMLVLAFALAGRIDVDLSCEPLSWDPNGEPVYLEELWPQNSDIAELVSTHVTSQAFITEYKEIFTGDSHWHKLAVNEGTTYAWNPESTYIKRPPYFDNFSRVPAPIGDIQGAKILLLLGDSVTTDHISPAGAIARNYPAGSYLAERGVTQENFNSYGSRRGNHEVMMRGTFGNIRIKNRMVAPKEGAFTLKMPAQTEMFSYDAAMQYLAEKTPLVVFAGKEYGTGSSRDWAAKGTNLLGIRAVIAESFERIHRNNLVGMGVLPLVFPSGTDIDSLGLDGSETIDISGLDNMVPRKKLRVTATGRDGKVTSFEVIARLDTSVDVSYFEHGGILPYVLRQMLAQNKA
ncbi:aconitate hydratase AcnA [Desulforhopalus singaporensis]|uniref:Aconitate hydratase n=1 Tax=Desulforhopalus singaporensis TaxID=91360 RepID=A0A1H0LA65_9BACT|nr:aconitate hydratase AcnA [Desulforhopalus singaporensis]SDO64962.1 aconitase [Desulforhopalus singaporensis]